MHGRGLCQNDTRAVLKVSSLLLFGQLSDALSLWNSRVWLDMEMENRNKPWNHITDEYNMKISISKTNVMAIKGSGTVRSKLTSEIY